MDTSTRPSGDGGGGCPVSLLLLLLSPSRMPTPARGGGKRRAPAPGAPAGWLRRRSGPIEMTEPSASRMRVHRYCLSSGGLGVGFGLVSVYGLWMRSQVGLVSSANTTCRRERRERRCPPALSRYWVVWGFCVTGCFWLERPAPLPHPSINPGIVDVPPHVVEIVRRVGRV